MYSVVGYVGEVDISAYVCDGSFGEFETRCDYLQLGITWEEA